ncbi:hypothetical protein HanIR_Chr07g0314691 [Helianthus annuus]|nr:hypothetical protein HanIR_Chr07g0314691 [Helianthus annuus]
MLFFFWNDDFFVLCYCSFQIGEPRCSTSVRLLCFNRAHASFRVWFDRSPGKQYRRLPLDSRCVITKAKLSDVTHGGTKPGWDQDRALHL